MKKALYLILGIIVLAAAAVGICHNNEVRREQLAISLYSDSVFKYSFMYNVDANLVFAVIKAESDFDENAVSQKGAVGLMQILPSTGQFIAERLGLEYSETELFDSDTNIKLGTYYIGYLSKKFTVRETMLAAYNAGEGNVRYWLSEYSEDGEKLDLIPFKETEQYVIKVKSHFERYRKVYNY